MLYNLHTHTYRCNHATGSDRAYVEYAIKSGIKVLGFSDHCPQFFPKAGYYSHFRMEPTLTEDYVKSVRSLAKEYKDDITILLGFETEYHPATFQKLMDFLKDFNPDYLILGQHLIGNEFDEKDFYMGKRGGENFLTKYVDQVIEAFNTEKFTYLAHPDLVNYKGNASHYIKECTRLCQSAKEKNISLEYNMLGKFYRRNYPNPEFWKIAKEVGNSVVIGFDAHMPTFLLNKDLRNECIEDLTSLGITPVEFEDISIVKP